MKKLMVAIAAVASAFGLYAAANGTSFEGTPTATEISAQLAELDTSATWSFTEAAETNVTLKAYGSETQYDARPAQFSTATQETYLDLATTFTNPVTRAVDVAFGGKNLYVDTLVKFTAADEDITVPADAKIAVWVKEEEYADNTTTNWLKVTAADADGAQATYTCGIYPANKLDVWRRLTIKALPAIGSGKIGFVVYLDGVNSGAACTPVTIMADEIPTFTGITDPNAAKYAADGQLFVAFSNAEKLSSIAMAGKGGIDDISFTDEAPKFAKDYQFVTFNKGDNVTSFTVTYNEVAKSAPAQFDFVDGVTDASVTGIEYADGYFGDATTNVTVAANGVYTIGNAKPLAATVTIGETATKCASIADAMALISSGAVTATLKLGANCDALTFANIQGVITLDLAGKTVAGINAQMGSLTIVDTVGGGIVSGAVTKLATASLAIGAGTFNGAVTIVGANATIANGAKIVKGEINPTKPNLTPVDDTKILDEVEGYWQLVDKPTSAKLTIPELNNVTVSATTGTTAVVIATAAGEYTVDIDAEVAVTWTATGNYFFGNKTQTTNETVTVPAAGTTLMVPATQEGKVKKGTLFFISLQDALDNDAVGTITLLADTTLESAPTLTKAETIDLNGKVFTFCAGCSITKDIKFIGEGSLAGNNPVSVSATFDLGSLVWNQVKDCQGGFALAATGKIIFPSDVTYPECTGAVIAENGAQIVAGGATYYKRNNAWTNVPWAKDGDFYLIANKADLVMLKDQVALGNYTNAWFKQTDNIDLNGIFWDGIGVNQVGQIAKTKIHFAGQYDGDNHYITNITFNSGATTHKYMGFFNVMIGATVKNLKLYSNGFDKELDQLPSSTGGAILGGTAEDSVFENITVGGKYYSNHNAGGFLIKGNGVSFTDCVNEAPVYSTGDKAGGFVAFESSLAKGLFFTNCVNKGAIHGKRESDARAVSDGAGGFIGCVNQMDVVFKNCSNEGEVTFDCDEKETSIVTAGGFIGQVNMTAQNPAKKWLSVTAEGCTSKVAKSIGVVPATNKGTITGLGFATVANETATYIAAAANDSYAMYDNAPVELAGGASITLVETVAKANVTAADAEHYTITKEGSTYTATANKYLIRFISGEGELQTNDYVKAYGSEFTVAETNTYKAVSGKTFAGWTPAVVSPVAGAAEYTATYEASSQPLPPGGSTEVPADKTKAEAEASVTVNVPSTISTEIANAGLTDTYKSYFEPVATRASDSDPWTVKVQMKQSVSNEVQTAVNTTSASIVAAIGDAEVTTATLVTKPGLYYGLVQQNSVSGMGNASPDTWTLATKTSMTFGLDKTGSTKFYKVMCSETGGTSNEVQK